MPSVNRAARRKLSRQLRALKFAVRGAQQAWQYFVAMKDEGDIGPNDRHIILGHCAAIVTSVINLQQKVRSVATQLGISPYEGALASDTTDHFVRVATIWDNSLGSILRSTSCSHCSHSQQPCQICSMPPFQLHAYMKEFVGLWDVNHGRRTRPKRKPAVEVNHPSGNIPVSTHRHQHVTKAKHVRQRQSKQTQTIRWLNTCKQNTCATESNRIVTAYQCSVNKAGITTRQRGCSERLLGTPRWVFHRWRIKVFWFAELGKIGGNMCIVCYFCFVLCYRNGK
jgi:hypothetical protein